MKLSDKRKIGLDSNSIRVLEEDNWSDFNWSKFYYFLEHKKFTLVIILIGESCNYSAYLRTKNGQKIEVDVTSPKASTPWDEVKHYYLIHAKDTYFRYRDNLRKNNE